MSSIYTPNVTQIQVANSTTYVDELGLLLGLDRLQGELASDYLKRLEFAAKLRRDHPYEGALNEVSLQLGFEPTKYIHLGMTESVVHTISISIAGVAISGHNTIPIVTFDNDTMWKWRLLSEVVADINAIIPATLLVPDGPAFQLARQSNSQWAFAEAVTGIQYQLAFPGVQVGSELFNQPIPPYTLTPEGLLTFSVEPDAGTEITYNYVLAPYDIVGSPIALIGLKDPEFASVAATTNSAVAYQVREVIQNVMLTDRSYWAK